uniref:Ilborin B n=1 Tax=Halisarca dujardinii TaxID=2583056 RepID=A0A7T0LY86_HALDU|nr:ilborin B [Halisarca dujardinii]
MAFSIANEVARAKADIERVRIEKRERLKNMEFFLLDNSIRESTVGQLRSHTLETKQKIFRHVQKTRAKHIVVASFSHMTRVDDDFCQWIVDNNLDRSGLFSFSEVSDRIVNGTYDTETIPVSMLKNQKYGLYNTFFEADLASNDVEWDVKFTIKDMCQLVSKWIHWVHDNITRDAGDSKPLILLNMRDLPLAMTEYPERVLEFVTFLSKMPEKYRMFALAFEDPFGEYLPEELEAWTAAIRRTMNANGWSSGKLLVHVHQKWDLQTASQLDCLSAGADGVWASMCEEGAALGHACSCVTMMNLVRMGNEKIVKDYNCKYLRTAAAEITKLTTGKDPHPKQPIYGSRAVDLVFGFLGIGDFDVADFFGVEAPNRITTLATVDMLKDRLENLFGKSKQFNDEICGRMKELMLEDLRSGRKEEYMSEAGIALLFDRSGGQLTERMSKVIVSTKNAAPHHEEIIADIRKLWDEYDYNEKGQKRGDGCLEFDSFYHGFMAPYFGCYRCRDTKKAFQAIDMDSDNKVDWHEFLVYIKWALRQYPAITTADQAMEIAFEKGLIPAMRDEKLKNRKNYKGTSFRN